MPPIEKMLPGLWPGSSQLGGVQDTLQELNTLAQADETDHHGNDHRQKTSDLGENTLHHLTGDDGRQLGNTRFSDSRQNRHDVSSLKKDFEKFIAKVAQGTDNKEEQESGNILACTFGIMHGLNKLLKGDRFLWVLACFSYLGWFLRFGRCFGFGGYLNLEIQKWALASFPVPVGPPVPSPVRSPALFRPNGPLDYPHEYLHWGRGPYTPGHPVHGSG